MGDDRVSRMAAVLVLAAGGEIRVPLRMIDQARHIRLHQRDDPTNGQVIYTATPYDRAVGGTIIDAADVVIEQTRQLPNKGGR